MIKKLFKFFFKKKRNCSTCKYATKDACKVFYVKQDTCYEGELWEEKS